MTLQIGDKVIINKNVIAVSQKTQKPLAGKTGTIKELLPKLKGKLALQIYIVKVSGELLPFCSNEITKK